MRTPKIMKHAMRNTCAAAIGGCLILLTGCVFEKDAGAPLLRGGGSETTLSGRVLDATGAPVPGAAIRVRPQDDPPPNLFSSDSGESVSPPLAYTGPDGHYRLTGLASGSYFVECRGASGGPQGAAVLPAEVDAQDSLRLPDAVLRPTGSVRGRITAPPVDFGPLHAVFVYVPGLWKRKIADESNGYAFHITDIPAGKYTLVLQPAYPASLAQWNILELTMDVASGDTLELDSLTLPRRAMLQNPMYSKDSAAAWAYYQATLDSGQDADADWVPYHTAVLGNRIIMLHDVSGSPKRLPKEILALDALESIYLLGWPADGFLHPISIAPEISNLPHLKSLRLEYFDLKSTPAWTGSFPALTTLSLSEGAGFPEWVLEVPALAKLALKGCSVTGLPKGITRLRNLRILDLEANVLKSLPPELMRMESLQGVRVRMNRLCNTTAEEKAWIGRQDSLWIAQADPLVFGSTRDTVGWEETQICGE
jgi:hypothetical protein